MTNDSTTEASSKIFVVLEDRLGYGISVLGAFKNEINAKELSNKKENSNSWIEEVVLS